MSMMKSNYPLCKTCKFRGIMGNCDKINISLNNDINKNNKKLYYCKCSDGSYWVSKDFGCINHDEK